MLTKVLLNAHYPTSHELEVVSQPEKLKAQTCTNFEKQQNGLGALGYRKPSCEAP